MNLLPNLQVVPAFPPTGGVSLEDAVSDPLDVSGYDTVIALLMPGFFTPDADNPTLAVEVSDDAEDWYQAGDAIPMADGAAARIYALELSGFPRRYVRITCTKNGKRLALAGLFLLGDPRFEPVPAALDEDSVPLAHTQLAVWRGEADDGTPDVVQIGYTGAGGDDGGGSGKGPGDGGGLGDGGHVG